MKLLINSHMYQCCRVGTLLFLRHKVGHHKLVVDCRTDDFGIGLLCRMSLSIRPTKTIAPILRLADYAEVRLLTFYGSSARNTR